MYDLFVLGCLIVIMLFIVYNFYIDYIDWSNTGNTFAEGMASQQIIININSKKPTWEEFKDKMSAQSDIRYYPNNFRPQYSYLSISGKSPLSKMVPILTGRDIQNIYKGKGGTRKAWYIYHCNDGKGGKCYDNTNPNFRAISNFKKYSNNFGGWKKYCSSWSKNRGVFRGGFGACNNETGYVVLYRRTYELPDFPWKKYGLVIRKPSWDVFKQTMLKKEGVVTTHKGKTLQIANSSSYSKILPRRYSGWNKLFVTPSTWAIRGHVYLYPRTYMLSGFDWTKWPVAPVSTWSSGGRCPAGCKKPICVSGNCKDVSILGKSYKSCSGTCAVTDESLKISQRNPNPPNVCKYDNQCTPELCGEEYFLMDDETPCSQKQWSNEAWDKAMGLDKSLDPIDVNRSICPGIGGPYGCGPIGEKEEERTIFTEREMKMVLANRSLIPTGINIRVENQGSFIRIGKNLMNDVSNIRNVAIPNISDKDYETLGRVIAKLKTDTGAQNEVTTLKLTNSINNILIGKPISNSQVDWGYEIPKSKQTTGMYGDNSNALMSKSEREAKFRDDIKKMSEKPDGGLCMWKGCERLGKAPYDSIWNLY